MFVFVFVFILLVLIHVLFITNKLYNIICWSLIIVSIVIVIRRTLSYVSGLRRRGWLLLQLQGWISPADLTVASWRDLQTATTPACLHNDSRS